MRWPSFINIVWESPAKIDRLCPLFDPTSAKRGTTNGQDSQQLVDLTLPITSDFGQTRPKRGAANGDAARNLQSTASKAAWDSRTQVWPEREQTSQMQGRCWGSDSPMRGLIIIGSRWPAASRMWPLSGQPWTISAELDQASDEPEQIMAKYVRTLPNIGQHGPLMVDGRSSTPCASSRQCLDSRFGNCGARRSHRWQLRRATLW